MKDTKRQVLPPGLWVVATPIGNLQDMTPRAQQALEEANLIFCEDTRRTAVLISALGMSESRSLLKRLVRLDQHTGDRQIEEWVEKLQEGAQFALVTDAGTPAVSDPGAQFVKKAKESGVRMTPIPGPSAVITLLSVAGFQSGAFTFRGFFPRKTPERKAELELLSRASKISQIYLWFESPLRISESLQTVAELFPDVEIVVGKELTKLHERIFSGLSPHVSQAVQEEIEKVGAVGEWCFAIEFSNPIQCRSAEETEMVEKEWSWQKALHCLLSAGVSLTDSAQSISQNFGISRKKAYEKGLEFLGKKINKEKG